MIRANNPAVDVESLMLCVREEAARLRDGGTLAEARRHRANAGASRLAEIIDHHNGINVLLNEAELRNQPRTQVPAKLAKLRGMGEIPVKALLIVFNYFFKQQREVDEAQTQALREMTWLVVAAAQDMANMTKRFSELSERLERLERKIDPDP